ACRTRLGTDRRARGHGHIRRRSSGHGIRRIPAQRQDSTGGCSGDRPARASCRWSCKPTRRYGRCLLASGSPADSERPMKCIALTYHDVYEDGDHRSTGRTNKHAELYKIGRGEFRAQLRLIQSRIESSQVRTIGRSLPWGSQVPIFLTFDDGGLSAYELIAADLKSRGWCGHFFITTCWIGRPGFVDAQQIRDLYVCGHVIGSHSYSHPERMSHLPRSELLREWRDSVDRLEAIIGAPVRTASVAGGYYSKAVAWAAASAGIEV